MSKFRAVMPALVLLATIQTAHAGLSASVSLVSDYDFRGTSQTGEDPALQLGANYVLANGIYLGAWASNVDKADSNVEVDAFLGFAGGDSKESFGYDVGVLYYGYPEDTDAGFSEIYLGLTKGWFGGKFWSGLDTGNAFYGEGNATIPLPYDLALVAHAGRIFGSYYNGGEYWDWSAGVTRSFGKIACAVKYIDSSSHGGGDSGGKIWASVSTTFPW